MFQKKSPYKKEWDRMCRQETLFLKKRMEQKESFLNRQLADKVPDRLQGTLDAAFAKAFGFIFEKGTGIIDRTFQKNNLEDGYKINEFIDTVKQNRRSLRTFSKKARSSGAKNLLISGTAGIGMGLAGVGLPDIPLFTSLVLKSMYEIALTYGYSYDIEEERYFILLLIQGAVSYGEQTEKLDAAVNAYMTSGMLPDGYQKELHIKETAACLSRELLYMKFLQGIPIVGAVGGACDAVYMKQITEYANIKYYRRFLTDRQKRIPESPKNAVKKAGKGLTQPPVRP